MARGKGRESKVKVKIETQIRPFGSFTLKEFSSAQEEVKKTKSSPIYVFPKSTAAIAEA